MKEVDSVKITPKAISGRTRIALIIVVLIALVATLVLILRPKETILVGFSAQLSGTQAELGVQERNGVQMAVEIINDAGGINGHKLELIIEDDYGIPEKAAEADAKLIEAGVAAIIGHATSSQTLAGLEVTNSAQVIMISPTVSTPLLSDIDDYFFRVYPSFQDSAKAFAQYIFEDNGGSTISVIYDSDNMAYTNTYYTTFKDEFIKLGGKIADVISYSSSTNPDFKEILVDLPNNNPQCLLLITSDRDAAYISQQTRILGWQVQLFSSAWAQTKTLIETGGQAVDGLILEQSYLLSSDTPTFLTFKNNYIDRFGTEPSFGAAFGYDAAMVLFEALKKTNGKADGLKEALTETTDFNGVAGVFTINQFGDVERPFYLCVIKDGAYIVLRELTLKR